MLSRYSPSPIEAAFARACDAQPEVDIVDLDSDVEIVEVAEDNSATDTGKTKAATSIESADYRI